MTIVPRAINWARQAVRPLLLAALVAVAGLAFAGATAAADPSASPDAGPATSPAVAPAPSSAPDASAPTRESCVTCHAAIDNRQHDITEQWAASVHGKSGIGCSSCHGGDPTADDVTVAMSTEAGFLGVPDRSSAVGICGECHANIERMRQYQLPTDQLTKYRASVHGQRLSEANDTRVAICTDCHGVHDVKKASDPTAAVFPLNVPGLCASCHADADLMKPYDIPTDQYQTYQASVHGKALLIDQDLRAPSCASCHGSHDAKPPQSSEVVGVCGKCHTATQALYEQSRHAKLAVGPKCWTCHGTHDVVTPDESRFFHPERPQIDCTTCHDVNDRSLVLNADRFTNDADRRCDTCHHDTSIIYSQAQAIHGALDKASAAYGIAEQRIAEAAAAGMIVSDADVTLSEAKTNLIRGRAEVHTTRLAAVAALTDAATSKAAEAQAFAEARLQESASRREAMVVVVVIILLNIVALLLWRRSLHAHSPG
ncbi:MAG TPA: cytochrome c3 family protein [Candidatus Limnocylindrales bacterium]|nr:cytochrome c3 family protein [Candidatus Limnocylindrales bacterium]